MSRWFRKSYCLHQHNTGQSSLHQHYTANVHYLYLHDIANAAWLLHLFFQYLLFMRAYSFLFSTLWILIITLLFLWFLTESSSPCRMIADPSFLYKLLLEQAATLGCSVWWEFKNRKGRYYYYYVIIVVVAFIIL